MGSDIFDRRERTLIFKALKAAANTPRRASASRSGVSLIELLVALAITLIFVGSVSMAFVQIIRASSATQAEMRATSSARAAVDQIARELRQLQLDSNPDFQQFQLLNGPLAYGNKVDDNGDGAIDDDDIDGRDNNFNWTIADDRHATVGGETERADYVGVADLGDKNVDEDFKFSNDQVIFIIPSRIEGTNIIPRRRISYRLGAFDTEQFVLLRGSIDNPTIAGAGTEAIEPVVFDAVSLDILAWNANDNVSGPVAGRPYWETSWDATSINFPTVRPAGAPFGVPPFKLPAAVYISVTVNAERVPLSEIGGWPTGTRPLKTITMSTVVNIESVIQDSRYFFYVRS